MITSDDVRFFAILASSRSLAAAARELNVSPSAVTQRLGSLERRLGTHLLERTGRALALTDEGELLVKRGRDVLSILGELDDALAQRRGEVLGHLRVIAPLGFGRRHVAPIVADFHAQHPRVAVDLLLSDNLGRVPTGNWDIAINVGLADDAATGLIMRSLAENRRFLCAAPSYIDHHGAPNKPEELQAHACIALRENDEDVTLWRFRSPTSGGYVGVRVHPMMTSNDGDVVQKWARDGHGIIVRSEWAVANDLQTGRLVRLLPQSPLPDAPVVALLGSRAQARASRTARFLEFLISSLHDVPWRLNASNL